MSILRKTQRGTVIVPLSFQNLPMKNYNEKEIQFCENITIGLLVFTAFVVGMCWLFVKFA